MTRSHPLVAAVVATTAFSAGTLDAAQAPLDTADVYFFADPETPVGASTLQRTGDGVLASFHATGVGASHALTLWWVVFNQPDGCSTPGCGADDIFIDGDPTAGLNTEGIAAADIVAGYASGTMTSADGDMYVAAGIDVDELGPEVILGDGALLKDAATAEIHLVARSHGPAIVGQEATQTTSYGGGCATDLFPPDIPDTEGECADVLFAVHLP